MTTTPTALDSSVPLQWIPPREIASNPRNPRKRKNPVKQAELTDSIRAHGVLHPLLVRPHPKPDTLVRYQLVFGECRLKAAIDAGLEEIPARCVEMDDERCLEVMLIENGRRDDLTPLEEAETYQDLRKKSGLTLAEIANRVGKSITTVHQRVKLMEARPEVRKALEKGEIEPSVAELIARRVHPRRQKDILGGIKRSQFSGPLPYREVKRIIDHEYSLRLSEAAWKLDDESLIEKAGSCLACPKQTGNQAELFDDSGSRSVCLDEVCFKQKASASRERRLEEAAADGSDVVQGAAAKKIFDQWGQLKRSSGFVNLAAASPGSSPGRPKSIARVLGKKNRPPVTLVVHPITDEILELAKRTDVDKALKAKGIRPAKLTGQGTGEGRRKQAAKLAAAVYDAQVAAVVEAIVTESGSLAGEALRSVVRATVDSVWTDACQATIRRRGLEKKKAGGARSRIEASLLPIVDEGTPGELVGLLVELLANRERPRTWGGSPPRLLPAVSKCYGVKLNQVKKDCEAYLRALPGKTARGARKKKASKRGTVSRKRATKKAAKKPRR